MWNVSKNMIYTPLFFCRNRDLGTISVYGGYRDVRCLPPYMYMVSIYVVSANEHLQPRGGDNKPIEKFVSGGDFRRAPALALARDVYMSIEVGVERRVGKRTKVPDSLETP